MEKISVYNAEYKVCLLINLETASVLLNISTIKKMKVVRNVFTIKINVC